MGEARGEGGKNKFSWSEALVKTANGGLAGHISNAEKILANDPSWGDPDYPGESLLAWDLFRDCVTTLAPPPWEEDYRPGAGLDRSEWTDEDDARATIWLAQKWNLRCGEAVVASAIKTVAQRRTFHPVKVYLEEAERRWRAEGERPRLKDFYHRYYGAPPSHYHSDLGFIFAIAAVARIYAPGCKVDIVIILEGPQGLKKSSSLLALCPNETWFYDSDLEIGGKDAYQNIKGKWIVELPELDSLSRADEKRIKAFFSSRADTYRPSYGRRSVRNPRQCVFTGTTNQGKDNPYLKDETGGRRFKPVACTRIDLEAIAADRDLLWGEAVALYKKAVPWHATTQEQIARFKVEEEARYKIDAWEERLRQWLKNQTPPPARLSMVEILADCFKVEISRMESEAPQKGASKALRRLGWVRRQVREAGERPYYYFPPGTPEGEQEGEEAGPWDGEAPRARELPLPLPPPAPRRAREPGDDDDE